MVGKDLERALALFAPLSIAALDHTGRALRSASLLPLGGRGIQAPHVTAQHASHMLIGAAASDVPQDAPAHVQIYAPLLPSWSGKLSNGRPDLLRPFGGYGTFGAALTAILSDPELADTVSEVMIYRSWPRAIIVGENPLHTGYYGFASYEEAQAAGHRATACALVFHWAGSVLSQLALDLMDEGQ